MPYEFKAPLVVKILFGVAAFVLIGYNVFYASYKAKINKSKFYQTPFSSKVINSNSFEGRTVEFHLENGLKLYFLPPVGDKIMVDDFIMKKSETYEYEVFRKNNDNDYKYFCTYYFDEI